MDHGRHAASPVRATSPAWIARSAVGPGSPSNVTTAIEYDEASQHINASAATEALMDIASFDAGAGFTFVMDDADDAANDAFYLAIGSNAVTGGGWVIDPPGSPIFNSRVIR